MSPLYAASFMVLYLNEYSMAQAVYTLHGDSKVWVAHLTKAQVGVVNVFN